jgi:hypothetical protein
MVEDIAVKRFEKRDIHREPGEHAGMNPVEQRLEVCRKPLVFLRRILPFRVAGRNDYSLA